MTATVQAQDALQDAMMELVDFVVTTDEGIRLPAFYTMSDARTFALMLRGDTGKAYYAREYQYDILNKVVYVVY